MREACPRRHTALARAKEKKKRYADGREMIALLEAAEEMQLAQAGPDGVSRAEQAEAERRKGNEAFARGQYQQATRASAPPLLYGAHVHGCSRTGDAKTVQVVGTRVLQTPLRKNYARGAVGKELTGNVDRCGSGFEATFKGTK